MFADVRGLGLALFASWIAARPRPRPRPMAINARNLAALLNSLALLALAAFILYEAYQRLARPRPVPGGRCSPSARWASAPTPRACGSLRQEAHGNLNVRAAYLEVLGDALGSVGVLVAAVVIMATGWTPIDSLAGVAIGLFIVVRTWRLLIQVVNVLLEGTPPHLSIAEIETAMRGWSACAAIHDLHVWTLTSGTARP